MIWITANMPVQNDRRIHLRMRSCFHQIHDVQIEISSLAKTGFIWGLDHTGET